MQRSYGVWGCWYCREVSIDHGLPSPCSGKDLVDCCGGHDGVGSAVEGVAVAMKG